MNLRKLLTAALAVLLLPALVGCYGGGGLCPSCGPAGPGYGTVYPGGGAPAYTAPPSVTYSAPGEATGGSPPPVTTAAPSGASQGSGTR